MLPAQLLGSAARSYRNNVPGTAPATALHGPPAPASPTVDLAWGRTARGTQTPHALPSAPHVPVADAQNLSRLPPRDLHRHRLQHYFLYLHCPLHVGLCEGVHALHGLLPPPEKRTYHLLSQPDISCATDTRLTTVLPHSRRSC